MHIIKELNIIMEESKFISNPLWYLIMLSLFVICGIITLIFEEFGGAIACFVIALLFSLPLIFLKKYFFAKMLINEQGIKIYYGKNILRELNWQDIIFAQIEPTAKGFEFLLSDKVDNLNNAKWQNWDIISINFSSNLILEIYNYKDKINIPINKLEILPIDIKNKFINNK